MVAHTTFNRGARGSSPLRGTVSFICPCLLVEGCRALNSDGQGSIPCMDALFVIIIISVNVVYRLGYLIFTQANGVQFPALALSIIKITPD